MLFSRRIKMRANMEQPPVGGAIWITLTIITTNFD